MTKWLPFVPRGLRGARSVDYSGHAPSLPLYLTLPFPEQGAIYRLPLLYDMKVQGPIFHFARHSTSAGCLPFPFEPPGGVISILAGCSFSLAERPASSLSLGSAPAAQFPR